MHSLIAFHLNLHTPSSSYLPTLPVGSLSVFRTLHSPYSLNSLHTLILLLLLLLLLLIKCAALDTQCGRRLPRNPQAGQANHGCSAWAVSRSCCLRYKVVAYAIHYAVRQPLRPSPSPYPWLTHFPSKICLPCWMRANICETLLNRATTRTSYFIFATVSCGRQRGGGGRGKTENFRVSRANNKKYLRLSLQAVLKQRQA